jgi:hypothetical protein
MLPQCAAIHSAGSFSNFAAVKSTYSGTVSTAFHYSNNATHLSTKFVSLSYSIGTTNNATFYSAVPLAVLATLRSAEFDTIGTTQ